MQSPASRGTIFLSHAAADKGHVEPIRSKLDNANVFYDLKSIDPGESTIAAMKEGVANAAVFVLFHSTNSETAWVNFEKDLAEIQSIINRDLQVLVCPLGDASYRTLPTWMQRYMTAPTDFTPSDIVRTILHLHLKAVASSYPEAEATIAGREDLQRRIAIEVLTAPAQQAVPLNVIVLAGVQGMGRTTLAREIIADAFRGMRAAGPIFDLPAAAGAVDWHLRFFEDQNGELTADQISAQIRAFEAMSPEAQAGTLMAAIRHWERLNQVIVVKTRWGLRDRGDRLHLWLEHLLRLLAKAPSAKLILISERRLASTQVDAFPNLRQYVVEELPNTTIEYILSKRIIERYLDTPRLPGVAARVHGHPATANYVAQLVNSGRSLESLSLVPDSIYAFQANILNSLFEGEHLSPLQKQILKLLSWFPRLTSSSLKTAFPEQNDNQLMEALWELNEFSLVDQTEFGRYQVPGVVSSAYRRLTDEHDAEIFTRVANQLYEQFASGTVEVELLESVIVGTVSERGQLPDEFRDVLTPAILLQVVEKEYFSGLDEYGDASRKHWKTAFNIAQLALAIGGSDDTVESTIFYGADAAIRVGNHPQSMIDFLRRKGYPSAEYLEGSYLYHVKRDYEAAANRLTRTLNSPNFLLRNVRLLARIYLRLGRATQALDALAKVPEHRLLRDTSLTIMKIRALRGMRRYDEAEALIARLGDAENEYGDLAMFKASQAFREHRYGDVADFLTQARRAPRSNKLTILLLQCAAEVEQGINDHLTEVCATARASSRESDALQLEARAALFVDDWRTAERALEKIDRKDYHDMTVELRMLEQKLADPRLAGDPVATASARSRREECVREMTLRSESSRF